MENNFFKALRKRLAVKTSDEFDRAFWNKFESEFKSKNKMKWSIWMPVLASGTLAIALILTKTDLTTNSSEVLATTEILESKELLEDMEFFMEFEEIATEEEDWSILLEGDPT